MNNYNSKKLAFPHTCPKCGKIWRRNSKNKQGYLCKKCGRPMSAAGESARQSMCHYCPMFNECNMRVGLGLWLCCETPDFADLERLKTTGGLDNERVRQAVDDALVQRGNRKILEEAISQSAPQIYKGIVDGTERQKSLGLRIDS